MENLEKHFFKSYLRFGMSYEHQTWISWLEEIVQNPKILHLYGFKFGWISLRIAGNIGGN